LLLLLAAIFLACALCSVVCELVCLSSRLDPDRRPSLFENVLELDLAFESLGVPFEFFIFVFLRCDDSTASSKVTFRFLPPFVVDFGLGVGVGLRLVLLGVEFSKLAKLIGLRRRKYLSESAPMSVVLPAFLLGLGLRPFFELSNPIFK
jgi:hypothetical protein